MVHLSVFLFWSLWITHVGSTSSKHAGAVSDCWSVPWIISGLHVLHLSRVQRCFKNAWCFVMVIISVSDLPSHKERHGERRPRTVRLRPLVLKPEAGQTALNTSFCFHRKCCYSPLTRQIQRHWATEWKPSKSSNIPRTFCTHSYICNRGSNWPNPCCVGELFVYFCLSGSVYISFSLYLSVFCICLSVSLFTVMYICRLL